ncbi:hypothetical protein SAMN02982989_3204 [Xaviernesmea oryzae]|uniref:Uncharacterized protein n=1 Tax=Xaviernesmea oryzae TaxID=464029 RepID=A0A1X7FKQ4_9HYPH|nr:hypothetical protein [Xaviernesmea oryzae]SMF53456.1 hypothetical protein SAMN02982989_3204 [Xaviernesmea oryzae]
MADIHEFPKTKSQREVEQLLMEAMKNVNDAIRAAAKCGFEISIVPLTAHATYSADPLPLVNIQAHLPRRVSRQEVADF